MKKVIVCLVFFVFFNLAVEKITSNGEKEMITDTSGKVWLSHLTTPEPGYSMSVIQDAFGKLWIASCEGADIDTYIHQFYPDTNYSTEGSFEAESYRLWNKRPIIACPNGVFVNIYCYRALSYDPTWKVEVYEVNASLFSIRTVTWNTRPPLGNLIYTYSPSHYGWDKIPTGTTGAIELVSKGEIWDWYSSEHSDVALRPYFTDL